MFHRSRPKTHLLLSFLLVNLCSFLLTSIAQANADIAKRISDGAAITGSRVLIVGFEGLAGFNYSKAAQLESYQCKISHGIKSGKPIGLGGGHVTSALLVPVVEKYKNKVKTAMFAHTACTNGNCGLPAAIASQWMADAGKENTDGRKLIIVGHSFGGDAAAILARQMVSSGVPIDSVFIVDGRRRPTGMGSVGPKTGSARWVTFFQVTDPLLMGFKVKGAENILLPAIPGIGHILLPHNKKILNSILDQIGNPPGEEITTAAQDKVEACKESTLAGMGAYRGTSGIVEGVPIAAVVGGGGYLAYQALKKKKSGGGGGDSGDILVADSLNGQGKSEAGNSKGESVGSGELYNLGGGETKVESSENIRSESSLVFLPQKEEGNSVDGASRESESKGSQRVSLSQRSLASGERNTRLSKDSLLMATGKSSANNIGGATSLGSELAGKNSTEIGRVGEGGNGSSGAANSPDSEESEKEEPATVEEQAFGFEPIVESHDSHLEAEKILAANTSGEFMARGSLFERVNRKLRQRMLIRP